MARGRLYAVGTAVCFDYFGADIQSETTTLNRSGSLITYSTKSTKEQSLFLFADAHPLIRNAHANLAGISRHGNTNQYLAAFWRILDRIVEQVRHYLLDPLGIG